jgi:hypothetical protein
LGSSNAYNLAGMVDAGGGGEKTARGIEKRKAPPTEHKPMTLHEIICELPHSLAGIVDAESDGTDTAGDIERRRASPTNQESLVKTAGRELRAIVGSPTRAAELLTVLNTRDVQTGARVSFIPADRDHDPGRLDAASGCEFVDDRIRLLD